MAGRHEDVNRVGDSTRRESKFRCAPECDNEEAAPRATRAGRHEGVSHKACPEGE